MHWASASTPATIAALLARLRCSGPRQGRCRLSTLKMSTSRPELTYSTARTARLAMPHTGMLCATVLDSGHTPASASSYDCTRRTPVPGPSHLHLFLFAPSQPRSLPLSFATPSCSPSPLAPPLLVPFLWCSCLRRTDLDGDSSWTSALLNCAQPSRLCIATVHAISLHSHLGPWGTGARCHTRRNT
ncbi:hypothetical protein DFH08DRAFT_963843 [Mycena albidolilacea]|uniref:Uncharacterized protein n=1 Tax=Mycena albidolilacea TaxID=1033008 RepID=A0AAD6ZUK3_9AGAR|nr:hypothetical protein DFH08DRAFT_963843 [Mycena albidolilacea]